MEWNYTFNYKDHWDPVLCYMLHITLLMVVYLDQLSGASHTHISYHDMNPRLSVLQAFKVNQDSQVDVILLASQSVSYTEV